MRVLDHLAVLDLAESAGRLWPADSTQHLGRGFRCRPSAVAETEATELTDGDGPEPGAGATRRLCGDTAETWFVSTSTGAHALRLEVRRPRSLAAQVATVSVNGAAVGRLEIAQRWETLWLQIPAEIIRFGSNDLRLEFSAVEATAPGVAARLRALEVHTGSPSGTGGVRGSREPSETGEPPAAPLAGEITVLDDGRLWMAGNAALTLAVRPGADSRFIVGTGSPSAAPGSRAWVELLAEEAPGVALRLPVAESVELDLRPWSGHRVLVRLRTEGRKADGVTWLDPRVTGGAELPRYSEPAPELLAATRLADRSRPPDILVILLDALRADALSSYGSERPTPAMDALAADGIRFARAFSTASWTAPATASLVTGTMPGIHGVDEWEAALPAGMPTIASVLAEAGYRTALWSHHVVWRSNRALRAGFQEVALVGPRDRNRLPAPTWLRDPDGATFALVHLLLPHGPYQAPEHLRGRYAHGPALDVSPSALRQAGTRRGTWPTPELVRQARDRYDEMVAWADAQVAILLAGLRASGRYDETVVVLAADHGEAFFEHGRFLHTPVLHRSVLGIPLILKLPGAGAAKTSDRVVSLIDVLPTLLAAAGLPTNGGDRLAPGERSVADLSPGSGVALDGQRVLVSPGNAPTAAERRWSLIDADHHLVFDPVSGRRLLYGLANDPGETNDLAAQRPVLAGWLLQQLRTARRVYGLEHGKAPDRLSDPGPAEK